MAEGRNPIKRTLEILGGTAKDIGKDYTSNLQGLITDANMVKSTVIQGAQTTKEKFDSMKNGTGPIKGLLNWFYTKEGETSSWDLDDADSEFDAGTTFTTDEDGNTKEEGPGVLDVDSAKDLTRGHINSMFKIAAKLTESQVATTAEITSTINSRSSEIIASVNNINTTLLGISKQLDTMSKVVTAGMGEQRRTKREDTLFDPSGRLTLGSVFDASQNAMKNSSLATYGSLFGTLKDSGYLTPELVMRLGYDFFLGDKRWKGLGDKSLNEVGQRFNDIIGQTVNDVMEHVIDNGIFKKLVGDLKQENRSNNFGYFTKNEYTRDPAVFDGMTRKSIVTIIPDYLKLIHEDLSGGKKVSVDERGNLTSREGNTWNKAVSKNLFKSGSMDYDDLSDFTTQIQSSNNPAYKNFKQYDINTVNKILTGAIVTTMQANNIKYFDKKWLSPDNDDLITLCAVALEGTKNLSREQWYAIVRDMITFISSNKSTLNKFVADVNLRYEAIHTGLEKAASVVWDQQNVGEITSKTFLQAAATDLANRYKKQDTAVPPTTASIATVGSGDEDTPSMNIGDTLSDIRNLLAASVKKTIGNRNYNKIKLSSQSASATIDLDPTYYEEKDPMDEERKDEEKKEKLTFQKLMSGESRIGSLADVKSELSKTYSGIKEVVKTASGDVTAVVRNSDGSETAVSVILDNGRKVALDIGGKAKNATIAGLEVAKNTASNVYNSNAVQNAISWTKQTLEDTKDWTKEKFTDLKNMASDKMAQIADNRSYRAYEKLQEMSDQANSLNKDTASEEASEDANTVRMITTSMQLAIQNGSASQDEKGTIQRLINTIHDPKLKAKMRKNVNTILDRSSFEVKVDGESGKKNIFSKILSVLGVVASPMMLLKKLLVFAVPRILRGGKNLLSAVFGKDIEALKGKFGELKQEGQNLRGLLRERRAERREERKERKNDPNRMTFMKAIQPATQQIQNAAKNVTDKAGNLINAGLNGVGRGLTVAKLNGAEFVNGLMGAEDAQHTAAGRIGTKVGEVGSTITGGIRRGADIVTSGVGRGLAVAKFKADELTSSIKDKFKSNKNENGSINTSEDGEDENKPKSGFGQTADNLKQMAGEKFGGLKDKFGEFSTGFKMGLFGEDEAVAQKPAEIKVDGIDEPAQTFTEKVLAKIWGLFTGGEKDPDKNVFEAILQKDENQEGSEEENKSNDKDEESGSSENGSIKMDDAGSEKSSDLGEKRNDNGSVKMDDINSGKSSDSGEQKNSSQMDDVGSSQSSDLGGDSKGGEGGESPQMDDIGSSGGGGGPGDAIGKLAGGAGGGGKMMSTITKIGKSLGKMTKIMGGIWKIVAQIVLKAIMMLSGFKALKKTLESVLPALTKIISVGLKPLNKIFNMINKFLKPIIKTVKKILSGLMEGLSQILSTIIDTIVPILNNIITPVLNALMPVIDVILNVLQPLFDVVSAVIDIVFIPLGGIFKYVLTPVIKNIGNMMQVIMGVLELGFGALMIPLGGILTAIGTVISILPFGSGGSGLKDSGKNMMSTGGSMIKQGIKDIGSGIASYIQTVISTLKFEDQTLPEEEDTHVDNPNAPEVRGIGSAFEGTSGNGDTSYTDSHDITNISNIYGAGNRSQKSYGNAMNMKDNGCGPAALADAHNRRHGTSYDGLDMAKSMAKSGAYEPGKGTSVGSFMKSSSALGDGLKAGGVTQASLKRATPTNPVTLVGSGSDFGTKKGNNHYVNVVGTDKYGGAYVSNPLTGRVDRRSASTLASSSVLGLYGSGDTEQYTFPDAVQEAMSELKSLTGSLLGMFTGKSAAEQMEDKMNKEGNKQSVENVKDQIAKLVATKDEDGGFEFPEDYDESVYGDDYFKYLQDKAKDAAYKDFERDHPRKDGETDDEYKKRFQKWYNEDRQFKYLSESEAYKELQDKIKQSGNGALTSAKEYASSLEASKKEVGEAADKDAASGSSSGGGSGYFTADNGVALYVDPYKDNIEQTETNIQGNDDYHSPLFEFFAKMMGGKLGDVRGSGWFSRYNDPNKEGVGQSGKGHGGIDFYRQGGSLGKPLYATTGGEVAKTESASSGAAAGNNIMWRDTGGMYHWYMHMKNPSNKKPGDTVNPGEQLGEIGNTGECYGDFEGGAHLHYTIRDTDGGWSSDEHSINPLMYFKNYNPNGGLHGSNYEQNIWSYLRDHGASKEATAGFMGNWQVESSNNPQHIEGYYYWPEGDEDPVVANALTRGENMTDYTLNKLFPLYNRDGVGYNKSGYHADDGNYYAGFGLAQWTGPRTLSLIQDSKSSGRNLKDLSLQLDKWKSDVTGSYAGTLTRANAKDSPEGAAQEVLETYEGVNNGTGPLRQQYAREIYDRLKDWDGSWNMSPTGKGSTATGYGMASSEGDARMISNVQQIGTTDGKNTGVVVADPYLRLRADKTTNSADLMHIPNGTRLDLEASGDPDWFKTTYGGQTGYVSSKYIKLTENYADDIDTDFEERKKAYIEVCKEVYPSMSKASGMTMATMASSFTQKVQSEYKITTAKQKTDGAVLCTLSSVPADQKCFYWACTINGYIGNGNVSSTGSNSKPIEPKNQTSSFILSDDDPGWKPEFYTDHKNYSEFMEQDSLGSWSPKPNGKYTKLTNAGDLLYENRNKSNKNEYWKNLENTYGVDTEAIVNKMYNTAHTQEQWHNLRTKYLNGKTKDKSLFSGELQNLHMAMYGHGDTPDDGTEALSNALGSNVSDLGGIAKIMGVLTGNDTYDATASSEGIPPLDTDLTDTMEDSGGQTIVNKYSIMSNSKAQDARLNAILRNTYDVRDEQVAALLRKILKKLEETKKDDNPRTGGSSPNLFNDDRIPQAVQRLSKG